MKLLHLSDLHLGKRVLDCSMIEEQRYILAQVLEMAKEADATLIAGDIYDRQVPPAEAVALLDDFLTRMSAQGSKVLMIAGNHDSAERIAFGSSLMDGRGVYVAPVYDGQVRCVRFTDAYGAVDVHLLPFLKPAHVRAALKDEEIEGYTQAMAAAIRAMRLDTDARHVLVAHQFVTGALRSESEEVSVGGLDQVDAEVFEPFDYVALGHLHAGQSLLCGKVRYCGAPLCYAFSECGDQKHAFMVTLGEKGDVEVSPLPFAPLHAFARVRGSFEELMRTGLGAPCEDYVQITLTDEDDIPDAAGQLRALYPNLLQILYDNARTRAQQADFGGFAQAQRRSPLDLFGAFFEQQNGAAMSEEQRAFIAGMMERIWEGEV